MSQAGSPVSAKRAVVLLNPVAGRSSPDEVRKHLAEAFDSADWTYQVHELRPEAQAEQINACLDQARDEGCSLIVAAGGDGTVSLAADGLVRHGLANRCVLGILPTGTANLLAGELGIPDDLREAAALLVAGHSTLALDAMRTGGRHFFLRVGAGLDAITMRDTTRQAKRWFGRLAYAATFVRSLAGYGSHRFRLDVDGTRYEVRAWQATIANGGRIALGEVTLGPDIDPADGRLDLCLYAVRRWSDVAKLLFQLLMGRYDDPANMQFLPVRQSVQIETNSPVPVQADGEPLGTTPIRVDLVPQAVRILCPANGMRDER